MNPTPLLGMLIYSINIRHYHKSTISTKHSALHNEGVEIDISTLLNKSRIFL
jgi:hypothetical protein